MRSIIQFDSTPARRIFISLLCAGIATMLTMASSTAVYANEMLLQTSAAPEATDAPAVVPTVPIMTQTPTPTATPTPVPTAPPNIVISEVYYHNSATASGVSASGASTGRATDAAEAAADWIELENTDSVNADLSQWWLVIRGQAINFADMTVTAGDLMLAPGESVAVEPGIDLQASSDLGLFADNNGEQPAFDQPELLASFVQWGSGEDFGLGSVAVEKGLWQSTGTGTFEFVPAADANESLALAVDNSSGAIAYQSTTPTLGEANPSITLYYLSFVSTSSAVSRE